MTFACEFCRGQTIQTTQSNTAETASPKATGGASFCWREVRSANGSQNKVGIQHCLLGNIAKGRGLRGQQLGTTLIYKWRAKQNDTNLNFFQWMTFSIVNNWIKFKPVMDFGGFNSSQLICCLALSKSFWALDDAIHIMQTAPQRIHWFNNLTSAFLVCYGGHLQQNFSGWNYKWIREIIHSSISIELLELQEQRLRQKAAEIPFI